MCGNNLLWGNYETKQISDQQGGGRGGGCCAEKEKAALDRVKRGNHLDKLSLPGIKNPNCRNDNNCNGGMIM